MKRSLGHLGGVRRKTSSSQFLKLFVEEECADTRFAFNAFKITGHRGLPAAFKLLGRFLRVRIENLIERLAHGRFVRSRDLGHNECAYDHRDDDRSEPQKDFQKETAKQNLFTFRWRWLARRCSRHHEQS